MLTPEEKRRINEALTKCNGNKRDAAAMLHMEVKKLRWTINSNLDLKAVWTQKGVAATAMQVFNGPDVPEVPKETPEEIEAREEAQFKKALEGLGEETGDVTEALALSKLYGKQIGQCINLIGGGITQRALALIRFCKKLDQRFDEGFSGENADVQLANWTTAYTDAHKLLARFMQVASLSSVAREKIKALQAAGGTRRGRTSFGPKTTNIVARQVQVNG